MHMQSDFLLSGSDQLDSSTYDAVQLVTSLIRRLFDLRNVAVSMSACWLCADSAGSFPLYL